MGFVRQTTAYLNNKWGFDLYSEINGRCRLQCKHSNRVFLSILHSSIFYGARPTGNEISASGCMCAPRRGNIWIRAGRIKEFVVATGTDERIVAEKRMRNLLSPGEITPGSAIARLITVRPGERPPVKEASAEEALSVLRDQRKPIRIFRSRIMKAIRGCEWERRERERKRSKTGRDHLSLKNDNDSFITGYRLVVVTLSRITVPE